MLEDQQPAITAQPVVSDFITEAGPPEKPKGPKILVFIIPVIVFMAILAGLGVWKLSSEAPGASDNHPAKITTKPLTGTAVQNTLRVYKSAATYTLVDETEHKIAQSITNESLSLITPVGSSSFLFLKSDSKDSKSYVLLDKNGF